MNRIARVFPRLTSMTPDGIDVYTDVPDLYTPDYDEVHISVTFTWDIPKAKELYEGWKLKCSNIKIGGPALDDRGEEFVPGRYLESGIVITSRGCPNVCPYCFVPKREGAIRELPVNRGHIIQDNNLLACSSQHIDKVFTMLENESKIKFSGGFEASRVTDDIVERLRGLRIAEIWLAYDCPNDEKPLVKAVNLLKKYFKRDKIRCYVMIGGVGDTIERAESRLRRAYEIGTLPFAQRYRTAATDWSATFLYPQREWNLLARQWSRPAVMKSIMKENQ